MKSRNVLLGLAMFPGISITVTIVFYFVNVWLFSSGEYFSPTDAFFVEGMLFVIFGLLLLLGRGGINLWSLKAAVLSALAEAVYNEDTVGPSEIMRKDRWKSRGFTRLALVLILTGVFMIIVYFVTL